MTKRTILNLMTRGTVRSSLRCKSTHKVVGTFGYTTEVTAEDRMYSKVSPAHPPSEEKPLVLLFGWAGASQKNLAKYGKVYVDLGCNVLEYRLPFKFFRHTEQTFEAMSGVLEEVEASAQKKTIVHCLSDTGVLAFQGLCVAAEMKGLDFKPDGIVWDSCLGPAPSLTIHSVGILTLLSLFARLKSGLNLPQALAGTWIDFRDMAWQNYLRKRRGLNCKWSMMNDIWMAYWARRLQLEVPELIIYSDSDLYLKGEYIEGKVIPARQNRNKDVVICRLEKSPHVGHLYSHPEIYKKYIKDLVKKVEMSI